MVDQKNQTKCLIATGGHEWMTGYLDPLPPAVRQRLRQSTHNLCPAHLILEFLPKVQFRFSRHQREKALFAAIEVMEAELRKAEVRRST
jgi:hypothetical protein